MRIRTRLTMGTMNGIEGLLKFAWCGVPTALRARLAVVIILVALSTLLNSFTPIYFKNLIDSVATLGQGSINATAALLVYLTIFALSKLVSEARWFLYGPVEQKIQSILYLKIFDHLHALPLDFHMTRGTGSIQQAAMNGLMGFRTLLLNFTLVGIPLVMETIMVSCIMAALYDVYYAFIVISTISLYSAIAVIGTEKMGSSQRAAVAAFTQATSRTADSLLNLEAVKSFCAEPVVRKKVSGSLNSAVEQWSCWYIRRSLTGAAAIAVVVCGAGFLLFISGRGVLSGALTIGDFVLINSYLLQILRPLEGLSLAYREVRQATIYAEGITELLGAQVDPSEVDSGCDIGSNPSAISFSDVSFGYKTGQPILNGVSFDVPEGRTIAIVGRSGAGKSTIVRLLLRFYSAQKGDITIGGCSISKLRTKSLRSAIAIVPQDTVLFNASFAENIAIAKPDCSEREIQRAAEKAELHDLIASLPEGYSTVIGERGLKLSGGERQRVAIARAVLKKPRIFVFDEATSALDTATEQRIQENIHNLSEGVTTIIIAHRLSTVTRASQVLVLDDGRIVERGTHDALLKEGGLYSRLWDDQNPLEADCLSRVSRPTSTVSNSSS